MSPENYWSNYSNKPQELDCTNVRTNLSIRETEAGRSLGLQSHHDLCCEFQHPEWHSEIRYRSSRISLWNSVKTKQNKTTELSQMETGAPKVGIWSSHCVQGSPSLEFWICDQCWHRNRLSGQNWALCNPIQFSVDNLITFGNDSVSITLCISQGIFFFSQNQNKTITAENKQ